MRPCWLATYTNLPPCRLWSAGLAPQAHTLYFPGLAPAGPSAWSRSCACLSTEIPILGSGVFLHVCLCIKHEPWGQWLGLGASHVLHGLLSCWALWYSGDLVVKKKIKQKCIIIALLWVHNKPDNKNIRLTGGGFVTSNDGGLKCFWTFESTFENSSSLSIFNLVHNITFQI